MSTAESEISQTFGDAALNEQNTYLPEDLLDRVVTLYAVDLTARVVMENQIHEQQRMGSTALNNLLSLKDFIARIVPVSSSTLSLSSHPVQPTTMGAAHAAQLPAPHTAGSFEQACASMNFAEITPTVVAFSQRKNAMESTHSPILHRPLSLDTQIIRISFFRLRDRSLHSRCSRCASVTRFFEERNLPAGLETRLATKSA
jgi:hypothetical protein